MTENPTAEPPHATPDSDITLGAADLVDFGTQPAPRKRRRTTIISSVAAVLLVAGGVGAYAGVRAWTGSGIVEPEAAMPASTAAFLRIDLKPGYRDQLAFDGLAKKFPNHGASTSDLVTNTERKMLEGSGLDYDTDVAPWFGQRAGIGAYSDKPDHVVGLIALASKDDAKAKQALTKVSSAHPGSFGFVIRDGFALLAVGGSDLQAIAEAAATEAAKANLAEDSAFTGAVSHLPGNNLLIGYADLSKVGPLAAKALSGATAAGGDLPGGAGMPGGLGLLPGLAATGGMSPTDALANATGHVVIGASVVDDGVEIHMHSDAARATTASSTNAKSTLDAMPDTAIVAAATRGFSKDSAAVKQLDSLLGAVGSADGSTKDPAAQMMQAKLGTLVTGLLTAKMISVEFSGVSNGKPNLVIAADTGDAAAASNLTQGLGALAGIAGAVVKQDGTTVRATVGTAPAGGQLGDNALYREAMKGVGNSSAAAYIDVQKLVALLKNPMSIGGSGFVPDAGSATNKLSPVKAIGFSSTSSSTSQDVQIRIVIK